MRVGGGVLAQVFVNSARHVAPFPARHQNEIRDSAEARRQLRADAVGQQPLLDKRAWLKRIEILQQALLALHLCRTERLAASGAREETAGSATNVAR